MPYKKDDKMKMLKLTEFFIAMLAIYLSLSVTAADAITIDFRDDAWDSANWQASYTIGYPIIGDITVKATPDTATLWHDDVDGMGIRYSYEDDEIEKWEVLYVSFASNINLDTIRVSDLFYESRSGYWYNEIGYYSLNNGTSWTPFTAPNTNLPSTSTNGENGEFDIAVGGIETNSLRLKARGYVYDNGYRQDHEFSLQSLEISQVPEPSTLLLLGSALIGVAMFGKKRLFR